MMSPATTGDAPASPHQLYKRDLAHRIAAVAPASLLDVGCGNGELLQRLAVSGAHRCAGLEVDQADVDRLRSAGLDVHRGVAEALPFADGAFDVVVMDYVAHHVADLGAALDEAARVARHAVLVLDAWYDPSIASQRTALAFDLWSKAIDRDAGETHNASPSAAELAEPFLRRGAFEIDFCQRLVLRPLPLAALQAPAERQLAKATRREAFEPELARIMAQARRDGVSDDGAILFMAMRTAAWQRGATRAGSRARRT